MQATLVNLGLLCKHQRQIRQTKCGASTQIAEQVQNISKPTELALSSAWRSNNQDVVQKVQLEIDGEYPQWLEGSFYRNGPGEFNEDMSHWFAGYSMITKIQFQHGKAYQQQRQTQTQSYKAFKNSGNILQFQEFAAATTPLRTLINVFNMLTGWGQGITDNANVNIFALDSTRLLAVTETVGGTYVLNANTLETMQPVKYEDDVKGFVCTAHPTLLHDGSVINIVHDLQKGYQLVKQKDLEGNRELVRYVPLELNKNLSSWIHDFPVTQNYAIVPETPIFLDFASMENYEYLVGPWKAELGSVFHIVPLKGDGPTLKIKLPAFFTFHYVNAFEFTDEEGVECIAVDLPYYEKPDIVTALLLKNLKDADKPQAVSTLKRFILPLNSDSARVVDLIPWKQCDFLDLTTINPNFAGREYRYAYGIGVVRPSNTSNMIQKLDVQSVQVVAIYHEQGGIVGEPLFVGNPIGSGEEDDGVVLCFSVDKSGNCCTIVLDAHNFEVMAKINMQVPATMGFHTCFKFD